MSLYFNGEEQSLSDILEARDLRVQYQEKLLNKYKNTLVSYKVNIPGPVKYNLLIKQIFDEGLYVFKKKIDDSEIGVIYEKVIYKNSGPEYLGVFNSSAHKIKNLTITIEESHNLGRLYDFDVLDTSGKQLSRQELGAKPRRCLLCENNAFECGRSRRHEISELIDKIESMALNYFNKGI